MNLHIVSVKCVSMSYLRTFLKSKDLLEVNIVLLDFVSSLRDILIYLK